MHIYKINVLFMRTSVSPYSSASCSLHSSMRVAFPSKISSWSKGWMSTAFLSWFSSTSFIA